MKHLSNHNSIEIKKALYVFSAHRAFEFTSRWRCNAKQNTFNHISRFDVPQSILLFAYPMALVHSFVASLTLETRYAYVGAFVGCLYGQATPIQTEQAQIVVPATIDGTVEEHHRMLRFALPSLVPYVSLLVKSEHIYIFIHCTTGRKSQQNHNASPQFDKENVYLYNPLAPLNRFLITDAVLKRFEG